MKHTYYKQVALFIYPTSLPHSQIFHDQNKGCFKGIMLKFVSKFYQFINYFNLKNCEQSIFPLAVVKTDITNHYSSIITVKQ